MRKTLRLALAACVIGCSGKSPTDFDRLAPPSPSVTATTRVVSNGGVLSLEVSASVGNPTAVHFRVSAGSQCPSVRIFSDPTGEYELSSGPACPSDGPTLDLAPGDSVMLKRVFPPDSLTSFSPGLYGVNVQVTTDRVLVGVWAGTVRLPLANTP
jgi:hypothetical protein